MKPIAILLVLLVVFLISIEMSIYGLLYINFTDMAHGEFWRGNLFVWLLISALGAFMCGDGVFTEWMDHEEKKAKK